jgi:hypothetical protein
VPQGPPSHERQQDGRHVAEGADGAGDTHRDSLPHDARQTPPDCRTDDNCAAQQEEADSVSPQHWVDIPSPWTESSHRIAQGVGEGGQDRGNTE